MNLSSIVFLFSAFYPTSIGMLITTIIGISTLRNESPLLSSVIFALPFVITIVVSPIVAKLLKGLPRDNIIKIQYLTRSLLIVSVLTTLYVVLQEKIYVIFPYVLLLTTLCFDQVLTSDAPLIAKDIYGTQFSSATAFGNFLGRGFQSVTPVVAAYLAASNHGIFWVSLITVTAFLGLLYPFVVALVQDEFEKPVQKKSDTTNTSNGALYDSDAWGKWYVVFSVLVNLSQGSVAFVLIAIDPNYYGPIYSSILYGAFFIVQIAVLTGFLRMETISRLPTGVTWFLFFNAIGLLILSILGNSSAIAIIVAVIGLAYGVSIPLLSEVILGRLRGPHFRQYLANAKSGGRLASIFALWAAGLALSTGISSSHLLMISSIFLAGSAAILAVLAKRLQKADDISTAAVSGDNAISGG